MVARKLLIGAASISPRKDRCFAFRKTLGLWPLDYDQDVGAPHPLTPVTRDRLGALPQARWKLSSPPTSGSPFFSGRSSYSKRMQRELQLRPQRPAGRGLLRHRHRTRTRRRRQQEAAGRRRWRCQSCN